MYSCILIKNLNEGDNYRSNYVHEVHLCDRRPSRRAFKATLYFCIISHTSFRRILRRAVDNQLYVATASPARDESASYVAWGHSTVVNPWYSKGHVVSSDQLILCVWLWRWRRQRMGACACPYVTQREYSKLYNWVISLVAKCDDQWWFSLDIGAIYWKLLFSNHDQLYGLSVGILGVKCCRLVIVAMCGFRGEVISKAGPEEAVIYADIGEWEERVDQTVPIPDRGVRAGVVIVSVCTKPLCVLVWPVPRPAVFSRHPAADPDHGSAPGRPLHGDVCAGRIELNAATLRRKLRRNQHYARGLYCNTVWSEGRNCLRRGNERCSLVGR